MHEELIVTQGLCVWNARLGYAVFFLIAFDKLLFLRGGTYVIVVSPLIRDEYLVGIHERLYLYLGEIVEVIYADLADVLALQSHLYLLLLRGARGALVDYLYLHLHVVGKWKYGERYAEWLVRH